MGFQKLKIMRSKMPERLSGSGLGAIDYT